MLVLIWVPPPINEIDARNSGFSDSEIAYKKLLTICDAINTITDFDVNPTNNGVQDRSRPQFTVYPSFAFSSAVHCGRANCDVGYPYRLMFGNTVIATYVAQTFIDLWKTYITKLNNITLAVS